ncbi:helix-turn-helix domain-containing protein [Neglectibacter timonensis]|uniref:helix-turn-helix domain-containing protein n=1 Tax=Neglectibacter timonensis TaxID=1776382 RepID=UPI0008359A60
MVLLSAVKVCSRICVSGKTQKEVAEWCLCSDRQVRNWCHEDTNISVSNLYSLADCLECKPEDLLVSVPMPERKE